MLSLLAMVSVFAPEPHRALDAVGALSGCWTAPGTVRGEEVTSVAKGEWHLGRRYFLLQLRSRGSGRDYSAAIIYGSGPEPNTIGSYWLDTFGGTAPLPVSGAATHGGFVVEYRFPDSTFINRFVRVGKKWHWTIKERAKSGSEQLFAEYKLTPTR